MKESFLVVGVIVALLCLLQSAPAFAFDQGTNLTSSSTDFVNGSCYNVLEIPNYFWDWLLLPDTIDETIAQLAALKHILVHENHHLE